MTDIIVFFLVCLVGIKAFQYGTWTISNKNITGGIFIFLLSLSSIFMGAYLLFFGGA